ncbi:MAG: hypothetical protein ACI8P0_003214, partial [Planctomycetaceae bacterium]
TELKCKARSTQIVPKALRFLQLETKPTSASGLCTAIP